MRAETPFKAPSVHVTGRKPLRESRGMREVHRRADALRWRIRWELRQRRPRPDPPASIIDHLAAAGNAVLLLSLVLIVTGG